MKAAIFTLTEGAKAQGRRLKEHLSQADLYCFPKAQESFADTVKKCFNQYDLLVFVMATGIVVRIIAPYLNHKSVDPAVIVMDEAGKNIISLLSGHMGGANDWTLRLAELMNGNPVITTASDIKGIKAVDTFAMENNLVFTDWTLAKEITAHLVNGGGISVYGGQSLTNPPQYYPVDTVEGLRQYSYGLWVSDQEELDLDGRTLQLFPKRLVVGIGCRRNTPGEQIRLEIEGALRFLGKSIHCIKKLATVDVKQDEAGIIETAKLLRVPLEIISRPDIKKVEYRFESSEFVKKAIGVGSVSEPCAFIGSGGGKILLNKKKGKGITLSVAEITLEV